MCSLFSQFSHYMCNTVSHHQSHSWSLGSTVNIGYTYAHTSNCNDYCRRALLFSWWSSSKAPPVQWMREREREKIAVKAMKMKEGKRRSGGQIHASSTESASLLVAFTTPHFSLATCQFISNHQNAKQEQIDSLVDARAHTHAHKKYTAKYCGKYTPLFHLPIACRVYIAGHLFDETWHFINRWILYRDVSLCFPPLTDPFSPHVKCMCLCTAPATAAGDMVWH